MPKSALRTLDLVAQGERLMPGARRDSGGANEGFLLIHNILARAYEDPALPVSDDALDAAMLFAATRAVR